MNIVRLILYSFILVIFFRPAWSDQDFSRFFPLQNLNNVYLAGPLFNAAERHEMELIAEALEKSGFKTFLPHRDGLEFAEIFPYLTNVLNYEPELVTQWMARAIDALDVYQVSVVNGSLVMNMNGRVADEGAIAELTIAWTLGKPTLVYKNDLRSLTSGLDNPLVTGRANFLQVESYDEIPKALQELIADLSQPEMQYLYLPPEKVKNKLIEGERIWQRLNLVRSQNLSKDQAKRDVAMEIIAIYGEKSCKQFLNF